MEKKYLSKENIVGKQVIDSNAIIIGNVKDMTYSFESKEVGLAITTKTGKEITVSGNNISKVGDVLLLNGRIDLSETPSKQSTQAPISPQPIIEAKTSTTPGLCRSCNFQNDPSSRFCIKCGTKL